MSHTSKVKPKPAQDELVVAPNSPEGKWDAYEAIQANNPFVINRVSDPSQMDCDVSSINKDEFERLVGLATEVHVRQMARGVFVFGEAGTGKSHLLARLSRWANDQDACFVFLHNIQVRPDDMGRYLLKCFVNRLVEDRLRRLSATRLFRIVEMAIRKIGTEEGITTIATRSRNRVERKLAERIHGVGQDADLLDVFRVIFQFFWSVTKTKNSSDSNKGLQHERLASLAVRWLKGEVLDVAEARELEIKVRPGEEVAELPEEQTEAVIRTIARLAWVSEKPVLLCIDQVDNMSVEQLESLTRVLHSLIDHSQNLLVVISGVRETLEARLQDGTISAAAANRFDHTRPVVLNRVNRVLAEELLHERLARFFSNCGKLPVEIETAIQQDRLFPLGTTWFKTVEPESLKLRPRDVLTWADDRWRRLQLDLKTMGREKWLEGISKGESIARLPEKAPPTEQQILAAIDNKVQKKVNEAVNARRLQPGDFPADAANLLGLTRQLLEQCVGGDYGYTLVRTDSRKKLPVDLVVHEAVQGTPVESHVMFVVTHSATSSEAKLRKLLGTSGAKHRILVTEEERCPLKVGAMGAKHLDELKGLGDDAFKHIRLSFEDYARLDALASVVLLARSNDLEIEPVPGVIMPVAESQVIACLHRLDLYRQHLLLREFLCETEASPVPRNTFPEYEAFREFVIAKLSFMMGGTMTELTKSFWAEHSNAAPLDECWDSVKAIILRMHNEELVSAKPWDDDLYMTIGKKA